MYHLVFGIIKAYVETMDLWMSIYNGQFTLRPRITVKLHYVESGKLKGATTADGNRTAIK